MSKLPVTFWKPVPDVKKEQAPFAITAPFVGLPREQLVSDSRKFEPSILTWVPMGPFA
jgi:hypothetical protein